MRTRALVICPGFRDPIYFEERQISSQEVGGHDALRAAVSRCVLASTLVGRAEPTHWSCKMANGSTFHGRAGPTLTALEGFAKLNALGEEESTEGWQPELVLLPVSTCDPSERGMVWRTQELAKLIRHCDNWGRPEVRVLESTALVVHEYGPAYEGLELLLSKEFEALEKQNSLDIRFCLGPGTPQLTLAMLLLASRRHDASAWLVQNLGMSKGRRPDSALSVREIRFGRDGLPPVTVGPFKYARSAPRAQPTRTRTPSPQAVAWRGLSEEERRLRIRSFAEKVRAGEAARNDSFAVLGIRRQAFETWCKKLEIPLR
jgi:hypothetical protein